MAVMTDRASTMQEAGAGSDGLGALPALRTGLARVSGRLRAVALAWGVSVGLAVPLALSMRASLVDSLGHSEAGMRMLQGWDGLWFRTWEAQATGLQRSFGPGVVGIGAVFRGLDAVVTGALQAVPGAVLAAAAAYVLAWVLLSGGLIAHYRDPIGSPGILREGARHFSRLLPLTALAALTYAILGVGLLPALDRVQAAAELDVIDERVAFAYAVAKYAVVWLLVACVGVVHDYAKILRVLDPSRSAVSALVGAATFVRRRLWAVVLTALGLFGGFVFVVALYWVVAPGVAQSNPFQIFMAFAVGQASVAARIGVRCWGYAARVALLGPARFEPHTT